MCGIAKFICIQDLQEAGELPADPLWPVHRLDVGTSGILLLARSRVAAAALALHFQR